MDSAQNKASTRRHIRAWCNNCRAEMQIVTPRDKEPKHCPMCKENLITESIRYA